MNKRGFSLLETVLYIGLLALILPGFILFYVQIAERQSAVDEVVMTEQKASLIFSELMHELIGAQSIDVTSSTLGVNPSTLIFVNDEGSTITIDAPTVLTSFEHRPDTNITRLRFQEGTNDPVWLTDPDIRVSIFQIDTVRDGTDLSGLNITIKFDVNPESQTAVEFNAQTTIHLQPQTTEL